MFPASGVFSASITLILAAGSLSAQTPNRGVIAEDVQLATTLSNEGSTRTGNIIYSIANLYSSPLVAFTLSTQCGPKHRGTTSIDAAFDHARPQAHGETRVLTSEPPECKVEPTAAIFADGRVDGDDSAVQRIMLLRGYALMELQPIVNAAKEEYQMEATHRHDFEPEVIEKAIVDRQSKMDKPLDDTDPQKRDENVDKWNYGKSLLLRLLNATRQLKALEKESDYPDLKRSYIFILDEWLRALQNKTYPLTPHQLRLPR